MSRIYKRSTAMAPPGTSGPAHPPHQADEAKGDGAPALSVSAERSRQVVLGGLLIAVLVLAYGGQRIFVQQVGDRVPFLGVTLMLTSALLLAFLVAITRPGRSTSLSYVDGLAARMLAAPFRTAMSVLALVACLAATVLGQTPNRDWIALAAWLASIVFALLAARNSAAHRGGLSWVRTHRAEAALVASCVAVAFVIRAVGLVAIPPVIGGDEGSMGLEAREILSGNNPRLFVTGWLGMPRMSFLLMALPMQLWGTGIVGLRMHSAIVGAATILPVYWLIRPEAGKWLAQGSIWLLATYPYHIHFSRLGANNIEDSLILAGTFAALFAGVRSRQPFPWALAGLFAALSLYFYPGARLVVVLGIALVAVLAIASRGRWMRDHWSGLLVGAAVFLVAGLPMIRFYLSHWNDFNARLNEVGIIQSGLLAREAERSGRSQAAILWDQFMRAFFAFGFYRDRTVWYNDTQPLLLFWPAVLFPLGLAIALLNLRRRLYLLLVIWFFLVVSIGGALTESPPSYARLNGLSPVLTTMVALALVKLGQLGKRTGLWSNRVGLTMAAVLVAALGLQGVRHYFLVYTPLYRYGSLNGEVATEAGKLLGGLDDDYRAYFLGLPRMYYGFSTIPFLAPQIEGSDAPENLAGLPPDYDPSAPALFFSIPEREAEMRMIQQLVPGGEWIDIRRVVDGTPLLYAYRVEPGGRTTGTTAPAPSAGTAYPAPFVDSAYPGPAR